MMHHRVKCVEKKKFETARVLASGEVKREETGRTFVLHCLGRTNGTSLFFLEISRPKAANYLDSRVISHDELQ
jgi:hypothetical protein